MSRLRRRDPSAWGRPRRRRLDPEASPEEQADAQDRFEDQLAEWGDHGPEPVEVDDEEQEDETENHG